MAERPSERKTLLEFWAEKLLNLTAATDIEKAILTATLGLLAPSAVILGLSAAKMAYDMYKLWEKEQKAKQMGGS